MFDHVTIRVSDHDASERFYATVLKTLDPELTHTVNDMGAEWDDFSMTPAKADRPVTRNLHVGFYARSREDVDAFWRAGVDAGYRDDGAPGPRDYTDAYYGAFLLDPDGNSVEAVHLEEERTPGRIDHLWLRVADVATARDFYAEIAPFCGLTLGHDTRERATFRGVGHSFSLVEGEPTENVHFAFGVADHAAVDAFHAAAVAAGYRSDGPPGERLQYHPGYYAAYVLDPDGNSVEAVKH